MPMRSQGRFLIGATALLGLIVVGPGCDSLPCRGGCEAPACQDGAVPPSQGAAAMGRPVVARSSKVFSIFRPAPRAAARARDSQGASAVEMLRPVPAHSANGEASVWAPVQRVGGEAPAASTTAPAGDGLAQLDRPQPIAS